MAKNSLVFNKINIQASNPNLYRIILVLSFINIGLGFNFIFANPTFNPYGIPKEITGIIFLALGLSKLTFLIFIRNLKLVRVVIGLCTSFMIFWGIGTAITFFQGKTSLQLFVLYMGLALIQIIILTEPVFNPVTGRIKKNGDK